jgi:uncharacterized protein YkuJ
MGQMLQMLQRVERMEEGEEEKEQLQFEAGLKENQKREKLRTR